MLPDQPQRALHTRGARLALRLGAAALCVALPGCEGLGRALGALATATAIAVIVVALVAGALMISLAGGWGLAMARGLRGDARSALVAVVVAAVWLVGHLGLVVLFEGTNLVEWLVHASLVPALALGASVALLARRRAPEASGWMALGLVPVLGAGLGWAWYVETHAEWRELPGRVTAFAGTTLHECALLSSGRVACVGANSDGELGIGRDDSLEVPAPVVGLDDATSIAVAHGVSCAIRAVGDAVCWGGRETLRPPSSASVPWQVPGSEGVVELAVTGVEIVGRRGDGSTFAWPHPLPRGIGRVRSVSARDTIDGRVVWVVSQSGRASCLVWTWDGAIDGIEHHPELGDVVEVAPNDDGSGCALGSGGELLCLSRSSYERRSPVSIPVAGLRSIVVLDGRDARVCGLDARSRVRCFDTNDGAEVELAGAPEAVAISTFGRGLCGIQEDGDTFCTAPSPEDVPTSRLLPFDREP